jgi:endonuclease III
VRLLCSLDEVGPKSALCVLLMSFDRAVFPVDAHVGRILSRIGAYSELGLDLNRRTQKERQKVLADMVPPGARRALHINLILHGRRVCVSGPPKCTSCVIAAACPLGKDSVAEDGDLPVEVAA